MKIQYIARKNSKLPNGDPESIHWGDVTLRAIKQTKRTTTWFGICSSGKLVQEHYSGSCDIAIRLHRWDGSVKNGENFVCEMELYGLNTAEDMICCSQYEIEFLLASCLSGLKSLYECGLDIIISSYERLGCKNYV